MAETKCSTCDGSGIAPWKVAMMLTLLTASLLTRAPTAQADPTSTCADALQGSEIYVAIQTRHIPLVCEAHSPGALGDASGWWDGTTIHLWPDDGDPPVLIRKVAAHELGHAWDDVQGLQDKWAHLRGASRWDLEDFAEMFAYVNFFEPTVSYSFYLGPLTDEERLAMRSWWAGDAPPQEQDTPPPSSLIPAASDFEVTTAAVDASPAVPVTLPRAPAVSPASPERLRVLLELLQVAA